MRTIRVPLLVLVSLAAAWPRPREARPTDWPVARFVENLEARLREEPDDANAHHTLGRAHAFAFALERSTLLGGVFPGGAWVSELEDQGERDGLAPAAPAAPAPADMRAHLVEGVRHLRRAVELVPDDPRHHLTLAWLLEIGAHLAAQVDTVAALGLARDAEVPEEIRAHVAALGSEDSERAAAAARALAEPDALARAAPLLAELAASSDARRQRAVAALLERAWIERAIAGYARALDVSLNETLESGEVLIPMGAGLEELVAREALDAYGRLVRARGVRPEEERALADFEARWDRVERLPRSEWITPIVLALEGCRSLDELVAPALAAPFDLDGDGVDELWPWLAPGDAAGWLVWDPDGRGEITSGRQLFGSASAWLFFADGYRVLDALDDDRDRELRGGELAGIAVWVDRDTDGVSDPGEVTPVGELGVVALATRATGSIGRSLESVAGVEMADGRMLPTYDWVVRASITDP